MTILKFESPTCGVCRRVDMILDSLNIKDVEHVNVTTPEGMKKAQYYGVQSLPTMIIDKNGKVDKMVGFTGIPDLQLFCAKDTL